MVSACPPSTDEVYEDCHLQQLYEVSKLRKRQSYRMTLFFTGCLKGRKEGNRYPDKVGMEKHTKQRERRPSKGRFFCDNNHPLTKQLFSMSKTSADQVNQACPLCNGQHALLTCSKFLKSSVDGRSEIIHSKNLCFGMSEPTHLKRMWKTSPYTTTWREAKVYIKQAAQPQGA